MTLSEDLRRRAQFYADWNADADANAMRDCANRGVPLADFEDAAGRLPHETIADELLARAHELAEEQRR